MCHWVLPRPQQETVLAAKGWQPSPSLLGAWIGVGGASLAQGGISHELRPQSRQGWMPGPCSSPGYPNQDYCAVSS